MFEFEEKNKFREWLNNKFPSGFCGYNVYYILFHPWEIYNYYSRQIKYAWQRVFRGWDDRVVWSIDWYLSEMIPIWIKTLKVKQHGIPLEMFDGLPYDENYCYSKEDEETAENKWFRILDQIAEGFESYHKIQDEWLVDRRSRN